MKSRLVQPRYWKTILHGLLVYYMMEAVSINPAYVCGNLSYLNLMYGMGKLYKVSLCV